MTKIGARNGKEWTHKEETNAQIQDVGGSQCSRAEYQASVDIRTCEIIEGNLPSKQRKMVLAWAALHQEELTADWNLVMNGEDPFRIQPLR